MTPAPPAQNRQEEDEVQHAVDLNEDEDEEYHQDELVDADARERYGSEPAPGDPDRVFQAKKSRLIARVVPMTLVPLSSANGMLVIGSGLKKHDKNKDCYFPLMEYLLFGGAVSLSLVVLAVVSKHMLEWVLYDNDITPIGRRLLRVLRYLGSGLAVVQLLVIIVGTVIIFPEFPFISYQKGDDNYCQEGAVVFTMFLLSMCWLFILFAAVCYIYIFYCEGKKRPKVQTHRLETTDRSPGPVGSRLTSQAPPRVAGHYVIGMDYPPLSPRAPPTYEESIGGRRAPESV